MVVDLVPILGIIYHPHRGRLLHYRFLGLLALQISLHGDFFNHRTPAYQCQRRA